MSVLSVKRIQLSQTGSTTFSGGVPTTTYVEAWRVKVDSSDDNWATIKAYAGLPQDGDTYTDDQNATCRTRSCNRQNDDLLMWIVVCNYSDEIASAGESDDSVGIPEETFKKIEFGKITKRRQVEQATYFRNSDVSYGETASPDGWTKNEVRGITNSALQPRRIETEQYHQVFRVTKIAHSWDGSLLAYEDSINSDAFAIVDYDDDGPKFIQQFAKHQAFCKTVTPINKRKRVKLNIAGGVLIKDLLYFEVVFEIILNKRGWMHRELDSGDARIERDGAPDGFGGTQATADLPEKGVAPHTKITDKYGSKLRKDVMLNGNGLLLDPYHPQNARYIEWNWRDVLPFSPLNL